MKRVETIAHTYTSKVIFTRNTTGKNSAGNENSGHPYLSYPDSPEPGISVSGHHLLVNFLLTSSKTHVANLLTHHIAAEGR